MLMAVGVVVFAVILGLSGLFLVDRLSDAFERSPQAAGTWTKDQCDLLAPRGLKPGRWFDVDGSMNLSELEAGKVNLAYAAASNFDTGTRDPEAIAGILEPRLNNSDVIPLSPAEQAVLAELDLEVSSSC